MINHISQPHTVSVRLAKDEQEIAEAQNVRFRVFYQEYGAEPCSEMLAVERDFDIYDDHADHLIVIDHTGDKDVIVGTYRLLTESGAHKCGQFYTSSEFNLDSLKDSGKSLLELGRSCVLPQYRTKPVLQLLWQGIADYITEKKIDIMFGCASLHTTDIEQAANALSYMYHYHLCQDDLCPKALPDRYVDMNLIQKNDIDAKRNFAALPPLLKGYFRLGGVIGDGAVIDHNFNTIDVCVMVETQALSDRYRKHYERRLNKSMHS